MKKQAICFLLAASLGFGQVVGTNVQAGTTPGDIVFSSNSQLVIETVNVKGKDGKPIEGLTAKDFTITEDGAAQEIRVFEYQRLDEVIANAAAEERQSTAVPFATLTRTQIAPEPPGDLRYRDRRLLALYFDMTAMPQPDQLRAFAAAQKFIDTQMTPADLMAVMIFSNGSVQVVQDFTGDRTLLSRVVQTLVVGEDETAAGGTNDGSTPDTGAAFGQNDAEFNIFFTDRQLAALQTAATMLGRLNEKKSLVYFASGMMLNGTNNQAQLSATINAAIRSGVSLWPVDARGLVAQAPLGDASRSSPGGQGVYTGGAARSMMANFQRSQDTLWTLAADTGGKALLDYNDLSQGIRQAQQATTSYYIVGYYTTNATRDGKFRRVKITLNNGREGTLDYRQGYYAEKEFNKFTQADKERQLEDALMLADPITELTMAIELNYFQLNRAEYFVPLAAKIPGSELALARRRGATHTLIDFIGEIKDDFGTTISNVRDKMDIPLSDATAAEFSMRPILYDTGFTLLPGKYKLKLLARDAETGRIGTFATTFTVPNLNKEESRLAISSVVLSSQRTPMSEALFNAKDKAQAQAVNPLVQDGLKLIPSVTRVFRLDQEMFIYMQAYQQATETPQPLYGYVTFYKGGEKAFESAPIRVVEAVANRLKTMPLKFNLPLSKLAPGEYDCQVTVLEPGGKKAAFWRAPIMLVP
jgi:VWFA-related protein